MRLYDLIQKLNEAPIQDYKTVGDFSKNSSFRNPRDRHLITNPSTIKRVMDKFNNTPYDFNMIFVNSPMANKHTEVGKVTTEWVLQNLGQEVYDSLMANTNMDDSINVVFTNNKGTQGVNMTGWIMAHRIAHVLGRSGGHGRKQFYSYQEAANQLHRDVSAIMELYGRKNIPTTYDKMAGFGGYDSNSRTSTRRSQLSFLHFMSKLCTFRSARENIVRDWFEILHELFAQYITTGEVSFNEPPAKFGTNQTGIYYLKQEDVEDASYMIDGLANTMEIMFDGLLSEAVGSVLVM